MGSLIPLRISNQPSKAEVLGSVNLIYKPMKKFINVLLALMVMLFAPAALFAADSSYPQVSTDIFSTFISLVLAIPLVVEPVKRVVNTQRKLVNQVISWVAGILLTMGGWYLHLGFLDGLVWYNALIVGCFASLAANGVYDTKLYEYILRALKIIKYPPNK